VADRQEVGDLLDGEVGLVVHPAGLPDLLRVEDGGVCRRRDRGPVPLSFEALPTVRYRSDIAAAVKPKKAKKAKA